MAGRITTITSLAATVAGLAIAGVCLAQSVNPADTAAVQAWVAAQRISVVTTAPSATWQLIRTADDGVLLRSVITPPDATTGQAVAAMRIEHFDATSDGPGRMVLSEIDSFAVDCKGSRVKALTAATYTQHNLSGDKKEVVVEDDWSSFTASTMGAVGRLACAPPSPPPAQVAARPPAPPAGQPPSGAVPARGPSGPAPTQVAAGPPPAPPPFDVRSEVAAHRWMLEQKISTGDVDNPDWLQLGWDGYGLYFLKNNLDPTERRSRTTPRAVERLERYVAAPSQAGGGPTLSETIDYDVNCSRKTIRKVMLTEYPSRNAAGKGVTKAFNEDFKPLSSDVMMAGLYNDICVVGEHELEDTAGRFQANF